MNDRVIHVWHWTPGEPVHQWVPESIIRAQTREIPPAEMAVLAMELDREASGAGKGGG